jgi:Family of unknown function (DUF5985)
MTTYVISVYGALIVMCVLVGLFFLRYWWLSRDRFFIWFAGAFVTFGVSWALLLYESNSSEHTSYIYAIRMLGFLQILAAILLKNRRRPKIQVAPDVSSRL